MIIPPTYLMSDLQQQYCKLNREYIDKHNSQDGFLNAVGSSLDLLEYRTALIQLGAFIKRADSKLEIEALKLYQEIHKEMKARNLPIPTPLDDLRYLGATYIKDRLRDLRKPKPKPAIITPPPEPPTTIIPDPPLEEKVTPQDSSQSSPLASSGPSDQE